MKQFSKIITLLLCLAMMAGALVACEPGETGPQGPQGIQGAQGEPGANGKDGIDGKDGVDGTDGKDGKDGIIPLKGKVIVNLGDSIFGNYRGEDSVSSFLAEYTGGTVYNCAFGGCRMAKHSIANFDAFGMYRLADAIASGNFLVQEQAIEAGKVAATEGQGKLPAYFEATLATLKSIDFSKVDIITIAYGTNDFTGGIALENESDPYDTTKFAGALRYSIETILEAFPNVRIFVCSPTYRFWMDADGNFVEGSNTRTRADGKKLTDFVAKSGEVATEYQLTFIDNYYALGINKYNKATYFPATDGTHLNPAGRELLARHIAAMLF
ncbi:MAG: hypothetical protein IKC31_02615 [Clostridia bacterium]|nr:hypothetical protein [Clostridia bacterium]